MATVPLLQRRALTISTNGAEKFRIAASGQIGLGGANYGTSGQVLTSNGSAAAPTWELVAESKNAIINGSFNFWQRGTSFILPPNSAFTADRWQNSSFQTDISRSTDVPSGQPFAYSLQMAAGNGTTSFRHSSLQGIEFPAQGLAGPFKPGTTWTLSCWLKGGGNGSIGFNLEFRNTPNSGADAVAVGGTSTFNYTSTWTRFYHTVTIGAGEVPNANNFCLAAIFFQIAAPAVTLNITGVQLEKGSVATEFEQRPIGTELALCQRYFQNVVAANATTYAGGGGAFDRVTYSTFFPVTMRTAPSVSFTGTGYAIPISSSVTPAAGDKAGGPAAGTPLSLVTDTTGIARAQESRTFASGNTVERGVQYFNYGSAVMTASAEL